MAKFKYRMQNILNIKLKLEEQAKMEYAQAIARVATEEKVLRQITLRETAYEEAGRKLRSGISYAVNLKENNMALTTLREAVKHQETVLSQAKAKAEEERMKLQEAMQERKTQEKLYEGAFENFIKEENARESKEVDELTSYTYGQKKQNGVTEE